MPAGQALPRRRRRKIFSFRPAGVKSICLQKTSRLIKTLAFSVRGAMLPRRALACGAPKSHMRNSLPRFGPCVFLNNASGLPRPPSEKGLGLRSSADENGYRLPAADTSLRRQQSSRLRVVFRLRLFAGGRGTQQFGRIWCGECTPAAIRRGRMDRRAQARNEQEGLIMTRAAIAIISGTIEALNSDAGQRPAAHASDCALPRFARSLNITPAAFTTRIRGTAPPQTG